MKINSQIKKHVETMKKLNALALDEDLNHPAYEALTGGDMGFANIWKKSGRGLNAKLKMWLIENRDWDAILEGGEME